jgi:hypothetical protein
MEIVRKPSIRANGPSKAGPYAEQRKQCEPQNCEYLANCFHGGNSIRFPIDDPFNQFGASFVA